MSWITSFIPYSSQLLAVLATLPVLLIVVLHPQLREIRDVRSLLCGLRVFLLTPQVVLDSGETEKKDDIEPLLDFDLWKADPIQYRPYKTEGHVTMGITRKSRNEWITMDRGYLARVQERERLIHHKPDLTICTGPLANPAIEELYTEIMISYLPHRYPTVFKTVGEIVQNTVTGSTYPLSTAGLTPERMLQLLAVNVEDDFFFMCPNESDNEFYLRGFVACFPSGFLPPELVGWSIREIHQPVPGYEERLGKGVDRYFRRMEPGKFIGRMNWHLQVDGPHLFRTDGSNYYPDTVQDVGEETFNPDFDQCFLRVEHQTLTCLPRSKAIIFCVRSYMTPLEQIKNEGDGPRLAEAIESMPERLGLYKMRHFWGCKVLPWLKKGPATVRQPTA